MNIIKSLTIRNLLLVYTLAVAVLSLTFINGVVNDSFLVSAKSCSGGCDSGQECNDPNQTPKAGYMWSCMNYQCQQVKTNSTYYHDGKKVCYLACAPGVSPGIWEADCGCNETLCVNRCKDGQKYNTMECDGCGQDFTCECPVVTSTIPVTTTIPPVTTTIPVTTVVVTTTIPPVTTTIPVTTIVVTTTKPPVTTTIPVTTIVITTTIPVTTQPPVNLNMKLVKKAVNGPGPYKINDTVHFSIAMTNQGSVLISHIKFSDYFDPSKLYLTKIEYNGTNITGSFNINNNLGSITHSDITNVVGDLAVNQTITIDFYFKALARSEWSCNDVITEPSYSMPSLISIIANPIYKSKDCVTIDTVRPTTDL